MVDIKDFFKTGQKSGLSKRIAEPGGHNKRLKADEKSVKNELESKPDVIVVDEIDRPSPSKKANKSTPKKEPKSLPKNQKAEEPETTSKDHKSVEEVLLEIPDAQLPDVDTDKKFNFFQKQQQGDQNSSLGVSYEIPEAAPNCLTGLIIVFTGVLPRMDRETSETVAKRFGAKVTKSISKKTSLVVIGEDAGPSKISKIKEFKIKAIDEDGFLDLLRKMPAEGGDGDAAKKAKEKREEQEREIFEEAKRQAEEDLERERKQNKTKQSTMTTKNATTNSPPSQKSSDEPLSQSDGSDLLWTVKYAPKNLSQVCGNKGQVQKLFRWLENWFENSKMGFKTPGPDGSGIYRACLISGPPGIGKTTAAHLVAKELGFDILEKNASDVRSKTLLNSQLKSALDNTSVVGFFKKDLEDHKNKKRFCLIMDEVDGMSSGDHAGAGALSLFARKTAMPMILIANDKSLPKMRTFDRVTFDLPFRRPSENEVKSRLMTIALRERVKLDPNVVSQLVNATHNDIRQMVNILSTVSTTQKSIGFDEARDISKTWNKQTVLKPFDITARFLSAAFNNPNSATTFNDKIDLYFNDIDMTPLMIQENYISTRPVNCQTSKDHLKRVATAADEISQSDQINSLIRSSELQWSLLPFHAVMSSVYPSWEVAGNMNLRINFSSWLGQNSKAMKYERLLQELLYHMSLVTSSDKRELRGSYIPVLSQKLSTLMINGSEEDIEEAISFMDSYYLTKEDFDSIMDFGVGSRRGELVTKKIATKSKSTFTRKYNAATHPVAIYKTGNSVGAAVAKQNVDFDDVIEDDTLKDEEEVQEETEGIDSKKDKLIKKMKPKAKKAKSK